jgi:hypothetical protein
MRNLIVLLFATISLFAQDAALARLKHEMAVARAAMELAINMGADGGPSSAAVHAALRDWIESQLPKNTHSLQGELARLQDSLSQQLVDAKLSVRIPPKKNIDPGYDRVAVRLKIMPEVPDTLVVSAGVRSSAGDEEDQAVYVYRFDSIGRTRIIADTGRGLGRAKLEVSKPDSLGRRLVLIYRIFPSLRGLSWASMSYAIFRMKQPRAAELLVSSDHGFWRDEHDPIFVLKPDQLIIERLDGFLYEPDTHRRTNIIRYSFADRVGRIEPMALQPKDFVEAWLTSSWVEMQSRSTPATQRWHEKLHADFVLSKHTNVVLCASKPGQWSIGLDIKDIGQKELEEPLRTYFLVRDLGHYSYKMEAVSGSEFEGCPGEGSPSDKHPWLSVDQLKALP